MELITLETFIQRLKPFAHQDFVNTSDISRLHLWLTELLVDHYVEFPLLKFLSRFLTQQVLDDIIEERNIEHICGYIVCDKAPKQQVRRMSNCATNIPIMAATTTDTKFQISNRKPSMILPNTYLSQYCCKEHYQASIFYRNQISNEALFARKDILSAPPFPEQYPGNWYEKGITCLEEVIAAHRELKEKGKSISEVVAMMNGLSMNDKNPSNETNQLIKLIQDFEIVENEPNFDHDAVSELDEEDRESMSQNIEGYVTTNRHFGGYVV